MEYMQKQLTVICKELIDKLAKFIEDGNNILKQTEEEIFKDNEEKNRIV